MNKYNSSKKIFMNIVFVFSILLLSTSLFVNFFVLNSSVYKNILEHNNTYDKVTQKVYDKIDKVLEEKSMDFIDIKESLITENDIKREADKSIDEFIDYLRTGNNNVKGVDTSIYKNRINDILDSIIGKDKLTYNDGQSEYALQSVVLLYGTSSDNMVINYMDSNSNYYIENLSTVTRSELEAKVRAEMAKRGLTEEKVRTEMAKRGISEEQAIKMAEKYFDITINDGSDSSNNNEKTDNASSENNIDSSSNSNDNTNKQNNEVVDDTFKSILDSIDNSQTSPSDGMNSIINHLRNDAEGIIESEVQKVNLKEIANSKKINILAHITSIFYELRYIFYALPVIFLIILVISRRNISDLLNLISYGLFFGALVFLSVFIIGKLFNICDFIGMNSEYLRDVMISIIDYFLKLSMNTSIILLISSIFTKILNIITKKLFMKRNIKV